MPSPFAVTAVSNSVSLDAKRHGEAAITVFNASGHPIRGRARLVPENAEANAWLSLAGVAERDFPIAGTEQYTVHIAVPRDAPAGSYAFRLDMVGVENPDELFTQGPTVSFEVPEAAPKKAFPWWIVLVAIGGLLLCGVLTVGGYLVAKNWPSQEPTATPGPLATATQESTPTPQTPTPIDETPIPTLITPTPTPATPTPTPVTPTPTPTPARVQLPSFQGQTEADAKRWLQGACDPRPCLNIQVESKYSYSIVDGAVIRSEPPAWTTVEQDSTVKLIVSIGSPECVWTVGVSEEDLPASCPSGQALTGMRCERAYCDNKYLRCCAYMPESDNSATEQWSSIWISEETPNNSFTLSSGFVSGIECSGAYCDSIRMQTLTSPNLTNAGQCDYIAEVSEESPSSRSCSNGWYVAGMRCRGSHCDNIALYCCKGQGPWLDQ